MLRRFGSRLLSLGGDDIRLLCGNSRFGGLPFCVFRNRVCILGQAYLLLDGFSRPLCGYSASPGGVGVLLSSNIAFLRENVGVLRDLEIACGRLGMVLCGFCVALRCSGNSLSLVACLQCQTPNYDPRNGHNRLSSVVEKVPCNPSDPGVPLPPCWPGWILGLLCTGTVGAVLEAYAIHLITTDRPFVGCSLFVASCIMLATSFVGLGTIANLLKEHEKSRRKNHVNRG